MNIDVTISDNNQEYFLGNTSLDGYCKMWATDMKMLPAFHKELDSNDWLKKATDEVRSEMDNCTKKLIREAELEIKKAKEFLKEKYPKEYKRQYQYVLIKNPFKTLLAKWLLRSK